MNKKFFSALLMGSLLLGGTFVSCTDYDDDIKNLQEQINNLATKSDVEARLSQLQSALTSAQSTATEALAAAKAADNSADIKKLEAKLAEIEKAQAAVEAAMEAVKKEVADKVADFEKKTKEAIEAAEKKTEETVGKVGAMVTEVSLVEAFNGYRSTQGSFLGYSGDALELGFMAVSEQTTVFGKNLPGEIKFEEGKSHSLQTSTVVVRVNPANATFTKDEVCLIDSKGNVLEYIEVADVKPYEKLLTRGTTTNSGLWELSVQMKSDVTMAELAEATTTVTDAKDTLDILYAVSIGNAERNVVSTYDIVATPGEYVPAAALDLFASDKDGVYSSIEDIHNRFTLSETGEATEKDELVWWAAEEKSVVPAIAEQIYKETKADKKQYQNVQNREDGNAEADDRQDMDLLAAEVGKAINLHLLYDEQNKKVAKEIAGFYVTLDTRNAVESAPSEINAWNSYSYENLDKVQKGNTGSITVKSESANGDVIGFRVYAVNLDGTLVDPDGRAFYVYVGDATQIGTVPTQNIKAIAEESKTTTNFIDDFKAAVAGVKGLTAEGWTNTKAPVVKNKAGEVITPKAGEAPLFTVLVDGQEVTAGNIVTIDFSKAKKVEYVINPASDFVDGGTYEQQMKVYKTVGNQKVLAKTITVSFTKVMPSEAPKITYITGQTGELLLAPVANPTELADFGADEIADEAAINLNNVYYQLSRADEGSLLFSVDNSAWVDKKGYVDPVEGQNAAAETPLTVANEDDEEFAAITDGSAHTIKFAGYYTNVSYAYDAEADAMVAGDFVTKETTNFDVTYNCWDKFTTWSWNKVKYESIDEQTGDFVINADAKKNVNQFEPELQWTTAGETISWPGVVLKAANTKNPEIFNASIADYLNNNVIVVAEAEDIFLEDVVDPEQINSYFVPAVNGDKIEFTMAQNSSNPAADVKQLLKVKFTDVFGHEVTLTLGEVTILRQK